LELTHFKDNFKSLAESKDGMLYWKEETLCRFLSLPDVLGAGPIINQMATYLGTFPFPSLAPAILTREAMVKVVVLMTERYGKVLKRGLKDRNKLLFRSLAVFDRRLSHRGEKPDIATLTPKKGSEARTEFIAPAQQHAPGFAVDVAGLDDDDEDDDELVLAVLDTLDVLDVSKVDRGSSYKTQQAQIPVDNFRQVILLLLVIAPLGAQEPLSTLAERVTESRLLTLKRIADSILWAFAPERNPGIDYNTFITVINNTLPNLFLGLSPLFEHFLFSKNLDLSRHRSGSSTTIPKPPTSEPLEPLLQEEGEILSLETLSQLSFILPPQDLFRSLRLLYSGSDAGFSINSISQKVLNWRAPSILLVSGRRLPPMTDLSSRERAFIDTLPAKRLSPSSPGNSTDNRLVFGFYLPVPWKQTHKDALGDSSTLLFQLEPVHDVFPASTLNRDYITFNKNGLGAGVSPPKTSSHSHSLSTIPLGPVSLYLDSNLEFGTFLHETTGGGAFGASRTRRSSAWQDFFEIDSLEVWGCGGDEEARRQREAWKWEEREAAARRGLNLGRDRDADYALLEMAGLVGGHGNSGGSMGG
jgi:hypothetical protein